jgi:hypothetical protein
MQSLANLRIWKLKSRVGTSVGKAEKEYSEVNLKLAFAQVGQVSSGQILTFSLKFKNSNSLRL